MLRCCCIDAPLTQRRRAVILLALTVAILLYASLYPWRPVVPRPGAWKLFWDTRQLRHELVLNILLYVPAGFLLFGATRNVALSIAFGLLLSGSIEAVQPFFARDSRAIDWPRTQPGLAAGTIAALLTRSRRKEFWLPSQPLFVLSIWGFHELYPFIRDAAYRFSGASSFRRTSPTQLAEAFFDWFAAFTLAVSAFPKRARVAIAAAALILPLRPLLTGLRTNQWEWLAWPPAGVASVAIGSSLVRVRRSAAPHSQSRC